ncbi:hypothetical protein SFR_2137 [Streptomyces sp. FR-008]|nr:hypothetical protein SFR_2137 [Streptomyces sp. FR-008]
MRPRGPRAGPAAPGGFFVYVRFRRDSGWPRTVPEALTP